MKKKNQLPLSRKGVPAKLAFRKLKVFANSLFLEREYTIITYKCVLN
jgi:hypothetical protein